MFEIESYVPLPDRSKRKSRHDDGRWLEMGAAMMAKERSAHEVAKSIVKSHAKEIGGTSDEGKVERLRKKLRAKVQPSK